MRAEAVQKVVDAGGIAAASPAALAPKVDVLITVVVNADQTEAVLFGENGAVPHMKPGAVVIASATVSPEFAKALGKRLTDAGLLMIDGPISGGAAKAMAGDATPASSRITQRREADIIGSTSEESGPQPRTPRLNSRCISRAAAAPVDASG